MHVIGRHHRHASSLRRSQKRLVDGLFLGKTVVLHLKEEVPFTENVQILGNGLIDRLFSIPAFSGYISSQTAGQGYQALVVFPKQFLGNVLLIHLEPQITNGNLRCEATQIPVAFQVFRQTDQRHAPMLLRHIRRVLKTLIRLSHLKLAAVDGLEASGLHCVFESHDHAQCPVVGAGAGCHAFFLAEICRSLGFNKAMVE